MDIITKEDVRQAFLKKRRKRNALLYEYYKDIYFTKKYSASFVAEKLSADLGVVITNTMVNMVYHRYAKDNPSNPNPDKARPQENIGSAASGKEIHEGKKESKKWKWTNSDDLPRKDPMKDIFKDI